MTTSLPALDPEVLFFGEPSAGLDPVSSRRLDEVIDRPRRRLPGQAHHERPGQPPRAAREPTEPERRSLPHARAERRRIQIPVMSRGRRANPALIGAFVLGGVALASIVVVVWGSGRFFRETRSLVCYFAGSVNGLNAGAPVKFRGVQIGSVTDMRWLEEATATTPDELRIPVWFDIDLKQLADLRGGRAVRLDRARLDELIAQGLRAQLQTESFVTGVLYVGLDFFPGSPIVLVNAERPDIFEIPTMPTALERASQTLTKLAARIEKLDIEGLLRSIGDAVDGFNLLVRSPQVDRTLVAAREALTSVRQLSDALKPGLQPMMANLGATSDGARASLKHLDATLTDLRSLIDTQGPLTVELTQTLIDLGDAAPSIRDLASYLDRNPNAVLTGRRGS